MFIIRYSRNHFIYFFSPTLVPIYFLLFSSFLYIFLILCCFCEELCIICYACVCLYICTLNKSISVMCLNNDLHLYSVTDLNCECKEIYIH